MRDPLLRHQTISFINMSPPTWLPPLNSHLLCSTSASASQFEKPQKIPSLEEPMFVIFIKVCVQFYSQDISNPRAFDGLCLQETHYIPCSRITGSSGIQRILDMFSHMRLPFQLENIAFREINHLGEYSEPRVWETMDSLARKIRKFLCNLRSQNADQNFLPSKLEIERLVEIPEAEHRTWTVWYDEKKRVHPDFERDYMDAISRPRTTEELWEELEGSRFKAATRSSIEALKEVRLEECNPEKHCLICLEEFPVGSLISCMPCSHIFHGDCIVKWLRTSHMCPLCRFKLPYS